MTLATRLIAAGLLLGLLSAPARAEATGEELAWKRLREAQAMCQGHAMRHAGHYPDGKAFTKLWHAKYPGTPVVVLPDMVGDRPDGVAARAHATFPKLAAAPDRPGHVIFVRIVPGGSKGQRAWRGLKGRWPSLKAVAVKGYAISAYDADGKPWWAVVGGK